MNKTQGKQSETSATRRGFRQGLRTADLHTRLAVLAGPAQGQIYAGNNPGACTTRQPVCASKVSGLSQPIDVFVPAPSACAKDVHAVRATDGAWMRYRAFLVKKSTGQTVAWSGWSGWSYATDVQAATWSGGSNFSANGPDQYCVDFPASNGGTRHE